MKNLFRVAPETNQKINFPCPLCLCGAIVILFLILSGCSSTKEMVKINPQPGQERFPVAVLPFENLSGTFTPIREIRIAFISKLKEQGFDVLDEDALDRIMARHRIRYVGGIDQAGARAFKAGAGVKGVLLTSLELYNDLNPPRIALTSRLVSTGDETIILWMDGVGLAGDDSPGILGLGLIEDPKRLVNNALQSLSDSLANYVWNDRRPIYGRGRERRFEPKLSYRSPEIEPAEKYTIAVIPFFNMSNRKNAGEIVLLHFVTELTKIPSFNVIEFGVVRQRLLNARVILQGGIALTDVDLVANSLGADFLMTGKVMDYQDYQGSGGTAKIDFSTLVLERKRRRIVWSSQSHSQGDDGVFFFDLGRVNTAYVMMSRMAHSIGEKILEEKKEVPHYEEPVQPITGGP